MFKFNILEKLFDKLVSHNAIKTIEKLAKKEGSTLEKSVVPNGTIYSYKTKQGCDVMHHFDKQGSMIETVRDITNPNMERLGVRELQFDNYQSGLRGTYRTSPVGETTIYEDLYSKSRQVMDKFHQVHTKKILQNVETDYGVTKRKIVGKKVVGHISAESELRIGENESFFGKTMSTQHGEGFYIRTDRKAPNGQNIYLRYTSDGFPPPLANEVQVSTTRKIPMRKFKTDTPGLLYTNDTGMAV